jgi:predicted ArsR family transcriptional regulator
MKEAENNAGGFAMTEQNSTMQLFREWVATLVSALEVQVGEDMTAELMEPCGRACAVHYGSIEQAMAIKQSTQTIDELLDKLNQQEGFWCGSWVRDGNTIYSVCEYCGCPLIRADLVRLSPTFCNCSRGWVKAVFEAVLERPVDVELEQAIGRGDQVCRFSVSPRKKEGA